ncbi:MAG: amidohydrolase family protein, partial [Bacteroidales bacterium]|nr:amidohydrolase family protein [Bacteroidales bacterium]
IDAHQHFWQYNADEYGWIDDAMMTLRRAFLPGDLEPLLIRQEFDGCIAVQARQTLQETIWLLQLAGEYSFIKGVVGWIDLCSGHIEDQLESLPFRNKLAGLRHVLQDEADDNYMLRKEFMHGIEKLASYNLAYDILIFPGHLPQTIQLVSNFPEQTFVLDHMAKPRIKDKEINPWKKNIEKLAGFQNVYCKISGMVTEADWHNRTAKDFIPYLDTVLNAFGTNRCMIGSDWPVCTVAGTYDDVIGLIKDYILQFSYSEQDMLLGGTAAKAYSLPR